MDELFDVVDRNDTIIGQATRDECHSNKDLIHRTVHFTLIDRKNRKVLLTQRSFKKLTDPGKLCFLGEHVLSKEKYSDAVKRGVQEELGIKINTSLEASHHIFDFPNQTEFVRFFLIDWEDAQIVFDREEIIDIHWVDIGELQTNSPTYSDMTQFWINNIDWNML